MLSRFYARIYHPLIYVGYGLEFGLLGMVAEGVGTARSTSDLALILAFLGLAQAACHPIEAAKIFPTSDLKDSPTAAPSTIAQVTEKLSTLLLNAPASKSKATSREAGSAPGVHAFELVARILKDDRFNARALGLKPHEEPKEGLKLYEHVVDTLAPELLRLVEEWLPDGADLDLDLKVEETSWVCALLYGVGGLRPSGAFTADFFQCVVHLVLSMLECCRADAVSPLGCTFSRPVSSSRPSSPTSPRAQALSSSGSTSPPGSPGGSHAGGPLSTSAPSTHTSPPPPLPPMRRPPH